MNTPIKYPAFNPIYFKLDGKPLLTVAGAKTNDGDSGTNNIDLKVKSSYAGSPVINLLSIPRVGGSGNYRFRYQLLVQNTGPLNGGDVTLRNYKLDGTHKNTMGGPWLAGYSKLENLPVWMGDGVNNASTQHNWNDSDNNKTSYGYGVNWENEYQKALDSDRGKGDVAWVFPHVYEDKNETIIKLDKVAGGITITFDFEVPGDLGLRDVTTTRNISGILTEADSYSARGDNTWAALRGTGGKEGNYEYIKLALCHARQSEIKNSDGGMTYWSNIVDHGQYLFIRFKFIEENFDDTNYLSAGWVNSVTSNLDDNFDYPLRWATDANALTDRQNNVITNSISWFNYKNEAITNILDIDINKKDVFQNFFIAKTNDNLEKSQPSGSGYGQIPYDITDNGAGENRNENKIGFSSCTYNGESDRMPIINLAGSEQKFGSSFNEHRIGGLSQTFDGDQTEAEAELNIKKYLSPYYIPTPPSIDNEYTVNISVINGQYIGTAAAPYRASNFDYELSATNEILTVGKWNSLFAKMRKTQGSDGPWTLIANDVLGNGQGAWHDFTSADKDNLIKINVFDSPLDVHFYVKDNGTDSDNLGYYAESGTGNNIIYKKRNADWEDTLYTAGSAGSGDGYNTGYTDGKLEGPDETNITLHKGWNTIGFTNHGFLAATGEGNGSGIGLIQNSIHFMQASQYIGQAPQGSGEDGEEGSTFMYGNTGYMVKCDKDINIKWTRRTTETIPTRPTVQGHGHGNE